MEYLCSFDGIFLWRSSYVGPACRPIVTPENSVGIEVRLTGLKSHSTSCIIAGNIITGNTPREVRNEMPKGDGKSNAKEHHSEKIKFDPDAAKENASQFQRLKNELVTTYKNFARVCGEVFQSHQCDEIVK